MSSKILIGERDLARLKALLDSHSDGRDSEAFDALDAELSRAEVVPSSEIPSYVVTMNSHVVFEDEETKTRREITLVYPKEADASQGKISILAPVGSALLGLSVGQAIRWPLPGGKSKQYKIVAVTFQPEASGNFEL
jgi:regulator of nucleoside diphosphate kinase